MSFADQSFESFQGGLVVATGGDDSSVFGRVGAQTSLLLTSAYNNPLGALVILLVILVIVIVTGMGSWFSGYRSGNSGYLYDGTISSGANGFFGERSDTGAVSSRASELWQQKTNGFMNSREPPYFPDVSNRVLRMENRERDAMRALGKINQERLRRSSEDSVAAAPLPWDSFWEEWKKTNPVDDDGADTEGFQGGSSNLMPNY